MRRRQRSLARVMLALFCMAWLQAAIVPCVMAHSGDAAAQVAAPAGHGDHGPSAGHDHHGAGAGHGAGAAGHPCMYCPPHAADGDDAGCDGSDCAYPHDPQVDARAAGIIFTALPVAFLLPAPAPALPASCGPSAAPEAVPRVRLTVSYCRFIE